MRLSSGYVLTRMLLRTQVLTSSLLRQKLCAAAENEQLLMPCSVPYDLKTCCGRGQECWPLVHTGCCANLYVAGETTMHSSRSVYKGAAKVYRHTPPSTPPY